jgi:hypothetical protein
LLCRYEDAEIGFDWCVDTTRKRWEEEETDRER